MIRSCLGRSLGISGVGSAATINELHEVTRAGAGPLPGAVWYTETARVSGRIMVGNRSGEAFNQRSMKVVDQKLIMVVSDGH